MHETRFEGIVIGYENWGDVDRLISFYTPHFGKLEVVAKGVRYEKSKLKGHLGILTHGEFMLAQSKGRGVLTDAVSFDTFAALSESPERTVLAAGIAEMYDAYLFPHAPDEALWQTLFEFLSRLATPAAEFRAHTFIGGFAESFLRHLGYWGIKNFRDTSGGASTVRDAATPDLRAYDALLYHTDIAGPTFSEIARQVEAMQKHAALEELVYI